MGDSKVTATIPKWVAAAKVDPKKLVFEITETAAIQTIEHAQRLSRELSALGCEIALDDFGSGFGSFYYLKHLPFDCLKVDGSFTRKLTTNNTDRVAVRAMIDIARGLGKSTVAECVEDEQTLELVRAFGFDHAQGFHIGKPAAPKQQAPSHVS
jgi:EAL domain-containing protein (putative c-di-GMP-specific phosphodiesterase class I)